MHLSDGVLNLPVVAVTTAAAGGLLFYSIKSITQEEIPKISLMTATFFVLSLISIPIGPSSVHPLLCGLLGIILGRRSAIAIFISLLLQALLFQHGGLTTLGANTLLVALPAIVCSFIFYHYKKNRSANLAVVASVIGMFGIVLTILLLSSILFLTSSYYTEGTFSVVRILLVGHIPLLLIEGILTGFIVKILLQVRPELIKGREVEWVLHS
ncbi:cobalt transporter CbiM [Alkalihalobacterium elongatum]|uniref:cobalt transporter CbiM n=1 Tax=Alkalihalobacterium elongatum TaxID=2675466 RepID=UPI001C1FFD20|nr:cobalt transporter CbiM [Alkalihalobacterium elongatum]